MDAFFAAVEQAAKPSLRGKPVVVGGLGPRGVVATASYEARRFGVRSAMPMGQARRLAPNAAYLTPRFTLYRAVSGQVMELLGRLSPLVEPLSLDEAFVDLEAGGSAFDAAAARAVGERLRRDIVAATGLTGSVGLAGSKMLAKIASEQAKPDGLVLIEPGTERELLAPLGVRTLPGIGPATEEHLRRAGMTTVAHLAEAGEDELVRLLGRAHGVALHAMALGHDDRPVVGERDAKSVSVEDTFDVDLHDRVRVRWEVERLAERCVGRLRAAGRSGRTVVLKVRRYDFSTLTRSETLRGPTDDPAVVREAAARLLDAVDTTGGVRLLGVGVSGLADYTQEDLFAQAAAEEAARAAAGGGGGAPGTADDPGGAPGHRGGGGAGAVARVGRAGLPDLQAAAREALSEGASTGGGRSPEVNPGGGAAGPHRSDGARSGSEALPGAGEAVGRPGGPVRVGSAQGLVLGAAESGRAGGAGTPETACGGSGEPGAGAAEPGADPRTAAEPVDGRGVFAGADTAGSPGMPAGRDAEGGGARSPARGGTGAAPPRAGASGAGASAVAAHPGERDGTGGGPAGTDGPLRTGGGSGAGGTGGGAGAEGARSGGPAGGGRTGDEERRWSPGQDVRHDRYGAGWVQGSGLGRVTVRFEEPGSAPGRVRTFRTDDSELQPSEPLPLVPGGGQPSPSATLPKSWSAGGAEEPGRSSP